MEENKLTHTEFFQNETFPVMQTLKEEGMDASQLSELKEKMLYNLEKHLGVIGYAAKETDINRLTHYQWMKRDPEYKKNSKSHEWVVA